MGFDLVADYIANCSRLFSMISKFFLAPLCAPGVRPGPARNERPGRRRKEKDQPPGTTRRDEPRQRRGHRRARGGAGDVRGTSRPRAPGLAP